MILSIKTPTSYLLARAPLTEVKEQIADFTATPPIVSYKANERPIDLYFIVGEERISVHLDPSERALLLKELQLNIEEKEKFFNL
jgi:hypothetical protein